MFYVKFKTKQILCKQKAINWKSHLNFLFPRTLLNNLTVLKFLKSKIKPSKSKQAFKLDNFESLREISCE